MNFTYLLVRLVLIFLLLSVTNLAYGQLTNQLVAHYPFNDGTATDEIGNVDGIMVNVIPTSDRFGNANHALDFAQSLSRIGFGDNFNYFSIADGSFSFSLWIQSTLAGNELFITKYGNNSCNPSENQREFFLRINPANKIEIVYYSNPNSSSYRSVQSTTTINDTCWHHVVINYNGAIDSNNGLSRIEMFIDDNPEQVSFALPSTGSLGNILNTTSHLSMGMSLDSEGQACDHDFRGKLDDVRFYSRLLTENEVGLLYREPNPVLGQGSPVTAVFQITNDTICEGDCTSFLSLESNCSTTWDWSFEQAQQENSDLQNPMNICFNTVGTHQVMLIADIGFAADTTVQFITVVPAPQANLGSDMGLCANSSFVLNVGSQDSATYLWQNGSTDSTFLVTQAGTYSVSVTTGCGQATDQVTITSFDVIALALPNDTLLCDQTEYLINAFDPAATSYLWSDGSTGSNLMVSGSGTYSVSVSNPCSTLSDTITVNFAVQPTRLEQFTFCSGSTVIVNEVEYFAETQLFTTLPGVAGTCDTLLETRIIEIPVPQSVQIDLETCSDNMVVYEGQMLSPGTSTTFTLTAANGCDSTVIVAVSAFYFEQTADYTSCAGDSVLVNGNYYSDAGNYQDTLASVTSACDTLLNFSIAVAPYQTASDTYSVCAGDSILINNSYYTPGNYRDTISSLTGCDTIYEYIVTGLNVPMVAATIDTCPGAVLSYGGQPIPASTTATVSLTAANGCDSLITLTVTPDLTYATALRLAACDGELATYNGTSLAIGDTLDFPFLSTAGCDSIVTVSVVEQNDYGEFLGPDTIVCGLEYFLVSPDTATFWTGGTQSSQLGITATGTYTATFQDALGCVITDDIFVEFPLRGIYLPNAFSPNGDGINDCFQPLFPAGLEFLTYSLTIFNRWGAPVYSSTSPQACWNGTFRGKSAQAGVYVWVLESVNAVCRETDSRSGSVTLVR